MFSQTFSIRIFFLARMKIKTRLFLLSKILFLQCGMFQNDSLISVGAGADKYGQVGSWTAVAFIGCWRWVRKMGRRGARHHPTEPEPGQHSLQHVPVHQVTRCTSHLSDLTCLLSSCSLAFLRISLGLTLIRFGMFPAFSVSRIAIQTFFYFVSLFFKNFYPSSSFFLLIPQRRRRSEDHAGSFSSSRGISIRLCFIDV